MKVGSRLDCGAHANGSSASGTRALGHETRQCAGSAVYFDDFVSERTPADAAPESTVGELWRRTDHARLDVRPRALQHSSPKLIYHPHPPRLASCLAEIEAVDFLCF